MPDTSHTKTYLPIEDYGIIGDLHTVALVGKNGSIDWCCIPSFDAPSIFGALLDAENGTRYQGRAWLSGRVRGRPRALEEAPGVLLGKIGGIKNVITFDTSGSATTRE